MASLIFGPTTPGAAEPNEQDQKEIVMRINAILMGGAFAVLAGMATAQSREEAVSLSMLGFTSVDGDGDASLTPAEIISYGGLVFISMDSDENEMLS